MRAIDADALRDRLQNLGYDDWNQGTTTTWAEAFKECADMVDEQPTIEPDIVRCKDCKYYIPYEWMFDGLSRSSNRNDYFPDEIGCSINDHNYSPDGYCSCAERREE